MELSESDKVAVLLNLQDMQVKEMHRREETEQKLFEWSTSLLLAAFAAIVALSQRTVVLPQATFVKVIATVMVGVPVYLVIVKIKERSGASVGNAEAVERIQSLLHLFDDSYYGTHSPYPQEWAGQLAKGRLKRKSPIQKFVIIGLMAFCVISTIWAIL
ncbi:MAG: hypothetical protein HC833_07875 [Leptolyngbyaceae cyanobacterium RM1_406_9]|nr:hypothetical protein [Leptolyngbyaceae cyanobacterium RM1_406_9]